MSETLEFVVRHGYAVLFVWMAAEQLGLPIPAIPLLLSAGALAGSGRKGRRRRRWIGWKARRPDGAPYSLAPPG